MKSPVRMDAALSPLPVPTACWRIVSLDMITQLPRTTAGFDCIAVFVDQFSKMVRLVPTTSNLTGPGFAKLFFQQLYPHYGLPLGICSDRGVQWNNEFFRSLCTHLGISLHLTFSYHPRANGQVERLNRVIEEALRHFVGPAHDDWDDYIPHIEFSINSAKTDSTGCTPFQLNRLTPPLSPTALAFNLGTTSKPSTAVLHRMYYHLAKQSLAEAKQSMWNRRPPQSKLPVFLPGDLVLLSMSKIALHHPSLRKKFAARWIGPCVVLDLVGHTAAKIELPSTLKQLQLHDVFHYSVLKHYVDTDAALHSSDPDPRRPTAQHTGGIDIDEPAEFEVEAVVNFRKSMFNDSKQFKEPHFQLKWVGYEHSENTWLPLDALSGCLDKVAEYLFVQTSASQRDKIIAMFPRQSKLQLAHLLSKAVRSRSNGRGSEPLRTPAAPRLRTSGPLQLPQTPLPHLPTHPGTTPGSPPPALPTTPMAVQPNTYNTKLRRRQASAITSNHCAVCGADMIMPLP